MKNCQKRNAVLDQKLWFRRDLFSRDCDKGDDASQMTVGEIINGKVTVFDFQHIQMPLKALKEIQQSKNF